MTTKAKLFTPSSAMLNVMMADAMARFDFDSEVIARRRDTHTCDACKGANGAPVALDDTDTCPECDVWHGGDACPECGGTGYHADTCPECG